MADMCYMIVTPDLEDSAGITAILPGVPVRTSLLPSLAPARTHGAYS